MKRNRSWLLGAGAAVVATAATVFAVTVLGSEGTTGEDPGFAAPTPSGTSTSPEPTASESSDAPPSESASPVLESVPVYYAGDTTRGVRLFREFHRVDTGGDRVSAAVAEAVGTAPDDPDYRTLWPEGTSAQEAKGPQGVITIDVRTDSALRQRPAGMTEEQARFAVEQVVYTAQAAQQARDAVQLLLNGERTDTLLGVPVSEPLAQGDPVDVLAQVWIIEPGEGAEATVPFEVSGLAAAFEANVQWELLRDGQIVKEGFTTAEECCTMAPYSFTVEGVPAGEYTLVVRDTDPSGGEGFGPWEDTKTVTVLP